MARDNDRWQSVLPNNSDIEREIRWLAGTATDLYYAYIEPDGRSLLDETNITVGVHNDCVKRAFQLSSKERIRRGLPLF